MTMAMNGCGKISVGAEVLGQRMRAETPDTPKERGGHQGQGHRPRKARTITTISVIPTESQFQKYCGTRGAWRHKRADCYCGKARNTAAVTDTSMSGTPTGNPVTAGTVGVVDRDRRWVTTVARDVRILNRNVSSSGHWSCWILVAMNTLHAELRIGLACSV